MKIGTVRKATANVFKEKLGQSNVQIKHANRVRIKRTKTRGPNQE